MSAEITITPADFDKKRFVKVGLAENTFVIGKKKITNFMTGYKYLNDDGVPATLFVVWPPQRTFGPSYNYPMDEPEEGAKKKKKSSDDDDEGAEKEKRDPDEATGMQFNYPLTSLQTIDKPTKEEKALKRMMEEIQQKIFEDGVKEANDDDTIMPAVSVNSFMVAEKKKKPELGVKAVFSPRMVTMPGSEKKVAAKDKPHSAYVKIWTKGKKDKLQALASFYGPGDRKRNPIYFMDAPGIITPTVRFDGAYHGAHAQNPWGTSIRWVCVEATYTPTEAAETKRRGPVNEAPALEDDSSSEEEVKTKKINKKGAANSKKVADTKKGKKSSDSDDDSGSFELENGDSKKPLEALQNKKGADKKASSTDKKSGKKEVKKTAEPADSDNDSDAKPPKKDASKKSSKDDDSDAPSDKKSDAKKSGKGADKKEVKKTAEPADSDNDSDAKPPKKGEDKKSGKKDADKKDADKKDAKSKKNSSDDDSDAAPAPEKSKGGKSTKETKKKTEVTSDDDSDARKKEAPLKKKGADKKSKKDSDKASKKSSKDDDSE